MGTEKQNVDEIIKSKVKEKEAGLVEFTQELIRTKSVNPPGNEEKVAKILIKKLEKLGFSLEIIEVETGRPNIVATFKGKKQGPKFLCYSHMDTVQEWDASKWSVDPFSAEIVDGKIYGRGTCDHKSEIACLITAFETLMEQEIELGGELVFIFDSDEEQGGTKGMQELIKRGYVNADLGLYACTTQISEDSHENFPTFGGVNIINTTMGMITYKFNIPGSKPHPRYLMNEYASSPGDHTMYFLGQLNQLVEKTNQYFDERAGHAKLWINYIGTNSKLEADRAGALGDCEVIVSRRVAPSEDLDQAGEDILRVVEAVEVEKKIIIKKELIRKRPFTVVPEESRIIKELIKAAEIVDGSAPKVTGVPSLTGMGWFVNEAKIPMVMFGYGNVDFHHSFDEHIAISDLVKSTQAYALAIKNILD